MTIHNAIQLPKWSHTSKEPIRGNAADLSCILQYTQNMYFLQPYRTCGQSGTLQVMHVLFP